MLKRCRFLKALFIASFKKPFSAVKGSAGVSSGAASIRGHVSRHHDVRRPLLCCQKRLHPLAIKARGSIEEKKNRGNECERG